MNTKDSFVMYAFKQSERKSIKVWTYKPQNWKNGDKIIFVMHGGEEMRMITSMLG